MQHYKMREAKRHMHIDRHAIGESARKQQDDSDRCSSLGRYPAASQEQSGFCSCSTEVIPASWLALRASVLRRAVIHSARPILRNATSSVSVGRSSCSATANLITKRLGGTNASSSPLIVIRRQAAQAVRPNHSLNRTFCGGPRLAFISFSAKHGPPQSAG